MRRVLTGIAVLLVPMVASAWVAYNDLAFSNNQSTAGNVTLYTVATGNHWQFQQYGSGGALLDYDTGNPLTETVSISGSGGGPETSYQGSSTLNGDAATYFGGATVDALGTVTYGAGADMVLTFNNLDQAWTYTLTYYANRDNYTTRHIGATLGGADAFLNESSAGIIYSGGSDTGAFQTNSDNTAEGFVMRWSGIDPGADGQITLTVSNDRTSSTYYTYGSLFALEAIPEPSTVALFGIGGLLMMVRRRRK